MFATTWSAWMSIKTVDQCIGPQIAEPDRHPSSSPLAAPSHASTVLYVPQPRYNSRRPDKTMLQNSNEHGLRLKSV